MTNGKRPSGLALTLAILLPLATVASGCGEGDSCRVGDTVYEDGSTEVPAPDGCNTCTCDDGALTACTLVACR